METTDDPRPTAVVCAVQLQGVPDDEHTSALDELARLVKTLGYHVVGRVSQRRSGLRSSTIFGQGKLYELAAYTGGPGKAASAAAKPAGPDDTDTPEPEAAAVAPPHPDGEYPHADVVVVDHEITPRQARTLEKVTNAEVLDRSGVIVEIFHRHAKTREARLQVEIARLTYVVPRLRAGGKGYDRQRGGVGGKGAGESSLELDRRKVRDRIAELRTELANIEREEAGRRARRKSARRVALIGYTNAGKSSLMRALTGSGVLVEDKLFATLGTTVRALDRKTNPRILISDTVGFIKKLPHDLVASFRSTLDEALEASILLYVVDASDPSFRSQLAVTREVMDDIGANHLPSRLVLNKVDMVSEEGRQALREEFPDAIQLCAHDPDDVSDLADTILAFFEQDHEDAELFVPYAQGRVVGEIHACLRVLREEHEADGTRLEVRGDKAVVQRIRRSLEA